ncbi:clavaminate synthase [Cystobacter fuscus DSM 2262]|uniref:Clavaminate synthase n=1 Tax=Cystobacter fuscus (strain ATCC 25194 / DSM 2262 / NBRC 100088 / M29) TaxID=1242864 RepID=S9Q655_CYSF2|nr:TauD/TfdA family dioxygenase [Cystobacter fuscus]EPX56814.1 clavaminate synthase [Cystobacter fuscus DSM 2262]
MISAARHISLVAPASSTDHSPQKDSGLVLDCRPFRAQLQKLLAERRMPSLITETERFLFEAELLFHSFPEPLRRAVCEFKSGLSRYPFIVLSGLPTDPALPPTPLNSRRPSMEGNLLGEVISAAFTRALGEPFGYLQQNEGEIFEHNSPVKVHERAQSGESSLEELFYHTDASFHPLPPDFVVLCCLRPDPERAAVTSFSALDDILARLTPRQREVLAQPRFMAEGVEYDYDEVDVRGNRNPLVPLLRGTQERPFIFYDQDVHRPLDPEAAEALKALDEVMEACALRVRLDAGDVALFDNRRSIHKRSPFQSHYDGTDRWCLLTYVSASRLEACTERRAPGRRRIIDMPANVP